MAKSGDVTIKVNLDMRCKRCSRDFLTCECPQQVRPGQYGPVGGAVGSYAARVALCSHGLRDGECVHCTWPKPAAQQLNELQDIANAEINRLRAQLDEANKRIDHYDERLAVRMVDLNKANAESKAQRAGYNDMTRAYANLDDSKWSVPDRERRRALVRAANDLLNGGDVKADGARSRVAKLAAMIDPSAPTSFMEDCKRVFHETQAKMQQQCSHSWASDHYSGFTYCRRCRKVRA